MRNSPKLITNKGNLLDAKLCPRVYKEYIHVGRIVVGIWQTLAIKGAYSAIMRFMKKWRLRFVYAANLEAANMSSVGAQSATVTCK